MLADKKVMTTPTPSTRNATRRAFLAPGVALMTH